MRDQIHCYSAPEAPGYIYVNTGSAPSGEPGWEREWTLNVHDMNLTLNVLQREQDGTEWRDGYVRFRKTPMELRGAAIKLTTLRIQVGTYVPDDPRDRALSFALVAALLVSMILIVGLEMSTTLALMLTSTLLAGIVLIYTLYKKRQRARLF